MDVSGDLLGRAVGEWSPQFSDHLFDTVVIGAGQAGLATAYELARRNLDFLALDSNAHPGGAWQHRWDSLTMNDVHGVADLPGSTAPPVSAKRANQVIPDYFATYEQAHNLPILRPVNVQRVENDGQNLLVRSSAGEIRTRSIVNATGTWSRPFIPHYPGQETFRGQQFHASTYPGPDALAGLRVLVVGGGASAVQFLGELAPRSEVLWATRREPQWRRFDGKRAVEWVAARTIAGEAPASVVSSTGLFLRSQERYAESIGVYERRLPMFTSVEADGVRWADGHFEAVDVILWATGFRPALTHLSPLHLKSHAGGIALRSVPGDVQGATTSVSDPRIHLVGYGPSASTIGSRRAARQAALSVQRMATQDS